MKRILFILLALSLFVPVACGKGGGVVDDMKGAIAKAGSEYDACMVELDGVKTLEDLTRVSERVQKVGADFMAAIGEMSRKYGDKEPSAEEQKVVADEMLKLQEKSSAVAGKLAEIGAKLGGENTSDGNGGAENAGPKR